MQPIDVYTYISSNNPRGCTQLLKEYGYYSNNTQSKDEDIRELIRNEGENAFYDLMKLHPDINFFEDNNSSIKKYGKLKSKYDSVQEKYSNAIGNTSGTKLSVDNNQTNTIILASAIILAIAIISKK